MKKKGFTLIELLAVIVILAIIALIATPIVMNVIENSKKGAAERSAENYLKAVETAVGTERIDGNIMSGEYTITDTGNLCPGSGTTCTDEEEIKIEMSGNKPSSGTIFIENGKVVEKLTGSTSTETTTIVTKDNYTVNYNGDGKLTATKNGEKEEEGGNQEPSQGENSDQNVVYLLSELDDRIIIGDIIDPADTTKFTTNKLDLNKNAYLKYKLDEDNKIIKSYACVNFEGEEVCMQGLDSNGDTYYDENETLLMSLKNAGNYCSEAITCYLGSNRLNANANGYVHSSHDNYYCRIWHDDGQSYCEYVG